MSLKAHHFISKAVRHTTTLEIPSQRHLEKIVVFENNDSSANQKAPQLDDTIWITLVRSAISMLCMAEKMRVRNSLSKLYKVTMFSNLLLGLNTWFTLSLSIGFQ